MPLALILPRGDQWYFLRKPLIRRDKGDTLSLLVVQILLYEPWVPCGPPPASLLLPRLLSGLAATTEPTLSFLHFFRFQPIHVSPVSRTASTTAVLRFLALFCLPSALPNPILDTVVVVPVPISATVLASVPVSIRCSSTGPHPRPRPRSRMCVCVCILFIKLHITAQSGPVILVILCHSHWSCVCAHLSNCTLLVGRPGSSEVTS